MDVSIIIVSYNTNLLLKNCIDSIYKYSKDFEFEIIVVDNASTDFSFELKHNLFYDINFISLNTNLGFAKANNIGLQAAKGKYIYFLNSDTLLYNNAILFYYYFYEKFDNLFNIGALGSLLKDFNFNETNSYGSFPSIKSEIKYFSSKILNNYFKSRISFPFKVDFVNGASLFVKKSVLDDVGLFDENFFLYYEETDLQKRMNLSNYNSFIIDGPKVIHLEAGSDNSNFKFSYFRFYHSYKSLFYYINKNHTGFYKYILFVFFKILRCLVFFDRRITVKEKYLIFKHLLFNE
jgi:GT2 family glycosyltransferase